MGCAFDPGSAPAMPLGSDNVLAARGSSTPAMRWVSAQGGLVEHRDECRAPAVLLAQLDDVLVERLRVARNRRGVSRALEDPHGAGVGSAIRLLENSVGHSLVDRDRVGWIGGLAALGEP